MVEVICPYCGKPAALVDDEVIYGRSYGHKAYWCKPCDAYVGCHKGTETPMGRLANRELRKWKMRAHAAFDMIWKCRYMRRYNAYAWLAEELNIELLQAKMYVFVGFNVLNQVEKHFFKKSVGQPLELLPHHPFNI